jgi:hypothetical protein
MPSRCAHNSSPHGRHGLAVLHPSDPLGACQAESRGLHTGLWHPVAVHRRRRRGYLTIAATLPLEELTAVPKPATLQLFTPANRKGVIVEKLFVWAVLRLPMLTLDIRGESL